MSAFVASSVGHRDDEGRFHRIVERIEGNVSGDAGERGQGLQIVPDVCQYHLSWPCRWPQTTCRRNHRPMH